MPEYVKVGETLLIEVENQGSTARARQGGTAKVGLKENVASVIEGAEKQFQSAIESAIQSNVKTFLAATQSLVNKPDELELCFGLKLGAELGSVIVSKVSGEATYEVKMTWKNLSTARREGGS